MLAQNANNSPWYQMWVKGIYKSVGQTLKMLEGTYDDSHLWQGNTIDSVSQAYSHLKFEMTTVCQLAASDKDTPQQGKNLKPKHQ